MKHVFFKPWIGKNYETGGIFEKKILVLGESHYCGGCNQCGLKFSPQCEEVNTPKVIQLLLNGYTNKWTSTFRKFERSLVNKTTTLDDSQKIWNSVAFYNFLQVAMNDKRQGGSAEDYEEGRKAFLEVLESLQPDLIIVWGTTRLYNNLPKTNCGWNIGEKIMVDSWLVPNGYYQLLNGKKSQLIAVWHPSTSRGYSWDRWYKVISTQL